MIRLERNIISSWIDRNPMLHLKRTGAYLKYVAKFWDTVFDTPLRDIDQFRLYLADKTRCTLSKREQVYAERCKEITYAVYAALVSEALDSEALMNIEDIERRAEKLLQTTPPFPIIIDLRTTPVSPAVGLCGRLCAAFTYEVGCRHHHRHGGAVFTHFRSNFRGRTRKLEKEAGPFGPSPRPLLPAVRAVAGF